MLRTLLAGISCLATLSLAQPESPLLPPPNGPRRADPGWHALSNATVHVDATTVLEHATVIVRDGRIVAVLPPEPLAQGDDPGAKPEARPARVAMGPRIWDCTGLHIYPGLIEPYAPVDAPRPAAGTPGLHWNGSVIPQRLATDGTGLAEGAAETLRKMGYVAACISPRDGIFRGQSAVVSLAKPLADASDPKPPVYRKSVYQAMSFDAAGTSTAWQGYPGSQMGAIALIRQTFMDADWQSAARAAGAFTEPPNALDALAFSPSRNDNKGEELSIGSGGIINSNDLSAEDRLRLLKMLPHADVYTPIAFDINDELEALRAAKLAREFNRPMFLIASGREYRRLDAIKADGLAMVLPLNFTKQPEVSSVSKAESTDLRALMAWEQDPTGPRRIAQAGIAFSLTTSKGGRDGNFMENLRKAITHGLKEEQALAAMTTGPAKLLGVESELGTIEPGKRASLVLTSGPIFEKKTKVRDVWIDGQRHEITAPPGPKFAGTWQVDFGDGTGPQVVISDDTSPSVTIKAVPPIAAAVIEAEGAGASGAEAAQVTPPQPAPQEAGADQPAADAAAAKPDEPKQDEKKKESKKDDSIKAKNVRVDGRLISYVVDKDGQATAVSAALVGDTLHGTLLTADGRHIPWTARRIADAEKKDPEKKDEDGKKEDGKEEDGEAAKEGEGAKPEGEGAKPAKPTDPVSGTWTATVTTQRGEMTSTYTLRLEGTTVSGTVEGRRGDTPIEGGTYNPGNKTITWKSSGFGGREITTRLTVGENTMTGTAADAEGQFSMDINATRDAGGGAVAGKGADDDDEAAKIADIPEKLGYPFGPYMIVAEAAKDGGALPDEGVITNATVWTSGPKGIIRNGAIAWSEGKILFVGTADELTDFGPQRVLRQPYAIIDAEGRHITPGLIDCHSHTGIGGGVNEGGQAVTAECRIEDVTDPDAINWYRKLAGGSTSVNNLHGSANAIGGQNQVNKVRWGVAHPDQMHLVGAKPGIKFALGENPTGANGGGGGRAARYPGSRMGVEQLIRDRFTAAREYIDLRDKGTQARRHEGAERQGDGGEGGEVMSTSSLRAFVPPSLPFRRDLELEALAEILEGKRMVHSHAYRQDEILMLCRVAKDFGFKIGTIQHALEAYKVAEAVKEQCIGASAFTDWWAYKLEVQDAIPQGPTIMHDVGIVVSYNSDDDELSRRMNTEAAKAVKYGGLPPEEALKFVTINPAIQLGAEKYVGSLEVGKDADIALWSGDPLSTMTRCEATFVDGVCLFSLERDAAHRAAIAAERQRLIQKILSTSKKPKDESKSEGDKKPEPNAGESPHANPKPTPEQLALETYYMDLLSRGHDPANHRAGVCGCEDFNR